MGGKLATLAIEKVFQQEADKIIEARKRGGLIHMTADIRAAGDETEEAVRLFLRSRLPGRCHIAHGHIADVNLASSPQLDVLIADSSHTPVLLKCANSSEYLPYESVFAIGEVKATFRDNDRPIEVFSANLAKTKSQLIRAQVPPNYISHGLIFGSEFKSPDPRPYKNPLFSFMLFVDGGDFDAQACLKNIRGMPLTECPSVICVLNKDLLLRAVGQLNGTSFAIADFATAPEFGAGAHPHSDWVYIPFGSDEFRSGANLAVFFYLLHSHIGDCILSPPNLRFYLRNMLLFEPGRAIGGEIHSGNK